MKLTATVLEDRLIGVDGIRVNQKHKEAKFARSYFYTHGQTAEKFAASVKEQLDVEFFAKFELKECGDHWAAFKGGASVWAGSHFWATFSMKS